MVSIEEVEDRGTHVLVCDTCAETDGTIRISSCSKGDGYAIAHLRSLTQWKEQRAIHVLLQPIPWAGDSIVYFRTLRRQRNRVADFESMLQGQGRRFDEVLGQLCLVSSMTIQTYA